MAITHDPDARLDYTWSWSAWLAPGETIASAEVDVLTVSYPPMEVGPFGVTESGTSVTAWLSGGVAGTAYAVRCRIVTTVNRRDDRTMTLRCRER